MTERTTGGPIVVVVGGGGEIGFACGALLARQGARVVIADLAEAVAGREADTEMSTVVMDVTNDASVATATEQIVARAGGVDVLVMSAGYSGNPMPAGETPDAHWQRVLDVNLIGTAHCVRHLTARMPESGGRVVIVSSIVAYAPRLGRSAYGSAKAALSGLTRILALELASANITVNGVCPGPTDTAFFRRSITSPDDLRRRVAAIPIGRLVTPADVAHAVAFLSSPAAGAIAGQNLHVNGVEYMT